MSQGWEAAERGEDPRAVPNHLDLVGPALELAKKVGSKATTVIQARQDPDFRAKGLLPQFTAANQKITSSAQQVHFSFKSLFELQFIHLKCNDVCTSAPVTAGAPILYIAQRVHKEDW